jgi:hypothetical protein
MIIFVDIDNTIFKTNGLNYENSMPMLERINIINNLYDSGHTIIYWTARGTESGKNWIDITKKQFIKFNVKHHELRFGKPVYDMFIDDKNFNSEDFFNGKHKAINPKI